MDQRFGRFCNCSPARFIKVCPQIGRDENLTSQRGSSTLFNGAPDLTFSDETFENKIIRISRPYDDGVFGERYLFEEGAYLRVGAYRHFIVDRGAAEVLSVYLEIELSVP